jgi:hypothetical protein
MNNPLAGTDPSGYAAEWKKNEEGELERKFVDRNPNSANRFGTVVTETYKGTNDDGSISTEQKANGVPLTATYRPVGSANDGGADSLNSQHRSSGVHLSSNGNRDKRVDDFGNVKTGVDLDLGSRAPYAGANIWTEIPRDPMQDVAEITSVTAVALAAGTVCVAGGCKALEIGFRIAGEKTLTAAKAAQSGIRTTVATAENATLHAAVAAQITWSRWSPVVVEYATEFSVNVGLGLAAGRSNAPYTGAPSGLPAGQAGYLAGYVVGFSQSNLAKVLSTVTGGN